jgi:signal transduction histidine kinase
LRSVDGFSQILLEDHAGQLDREGRDYLHRIRAASQRMAQLIDDMLTLSRVSRAEMHRQDVDLSALAVELLADLRKSEPGRDVTIVVRPGLVAQGDPRLLRIAMENLLNNAWKFSSHKPGARIEFGQELVEGDVAFFVRDTGAGFDMTYVDKLFRAFQRLHAASEFSGTGIGLAIVQRVIHKHGGRVWAEGEEGKGATFHFTLQT